MNRTYQFRLYPTKKQQAVLGGWLALCCEVYNAALQERRDAYRMAGLSIGFAQQCAALPACKEVRQDLAEVHSQVLQDVLKRVDLAFAAFFRRCQAGEQPGYPRFRSLSRYDSLAFKRYQNSFDVHSRKNHKGTLVLSKVGQIKMVMHRPLKGVPKTATVKRTATNKWFVSISVESEQEADVLPPSAEQVGIDVGLYTFAYLSTGEHIANPHFFRDEERALAQAQRRLSKAHKGSKQREKWRKVVAGKLHPPTDGLPDQPLRVHCGGSTGGAQPGQKPKSGEKYCRCGVVVLLRITPQQSGGSWPCSGASESGLYIANLFGMFPSTRDAPLRAHL